MSNCVPLNWTTVRLQIKERCDVGRAVVFLWEEGVSRGLISHSKDYVRRNDPIVDIGAWKRYERFLFDLLQAGDVQ